MTNITPILCSILQEVHSADPITNNVPTSHTLDTFLQEAYRINTHISSLLTYLRRIRQPYLSTAPPPRRVLSGSSAISVSSSSATTVHLTDPQRAQIDADTSLLLRDLSANISSLSTVESLRVSTETALLEKKYSKQTGILWRWAGGRGDEDHESWSSKSAEQEEDEGRARTVKTVREGVLWYLGRELTRAVEMKREMVEIRCEREREREKSVLWKKSGGKQSTQQGQFARASEGIHDDGSPKSPTVVNGSASYPPLEPPQNNHPSTLTPNEFQSSTSAPPIESLLTPAQLSLFASENSTLLTHYNDTLTKVTAAEKSLLEISELQSTLVSHLSTQGELIEQLVQDAQGTDENLRRGNRELKKASERTSTARGVFWVTVGLCGFLVGWDFVF